MSQENVELMLESYDAFNRRDWDAFWRWLTTSWRSNRGW
jgi:hypothetical protein